MNRPIQVLSRLKHLNASAGFVVLVLMLAVLIAAPIHGGHGGRFSYLSERAVIVAFIVLALAGALYIGIWYVFALWRIVRDRGAGVFAAGDVLVYISPLLWRADIRRIRQVSLRRSAGFVANEAVVVEFDDGSKKSIPAALLSEPAATIAQRIRGIAGIS